MNEIISNAVKVNRGDQSSFLYYTKESGKIIYRDKIDTLIGIKHPGIILGKDIWNRLWVIHNHYQIGFPQIVPFNQFSIGTDVLFDKRPVFYNTSKIIQRAIDHWIEKKEYSWLFHNCQHFVNNITQNKYYSETINNVSNKAMIGGGILTLIGLMAEDSQIIKTGLAITGVGVAGKVASSK
jgi:hypothetical protein